MASSTRTKPLTLLCRLPSRRASRISRLGTLASSVTFAAGETVKTVRITLKPDTTFEGDEVFYVFLNASSANVTRADDIAEVRIIDNDASTGTPNVSK